MRGCVMLAVCAAASACGSVGDPVPVIFEPITNASFEAFYDAVRVITPSDDIPVEGSASYAGAVRLDVVDAAAAPLAALTGQMAVTVDFGDTSGAALSDVPLRGTLSDFAGETVDGDPYAWTGDIVAAPDASVTVASFTVSDGAGGTITTRTGVLGADFAGDVIVSDGSDSFAVTAHVTLDGSFVGPTGTGVWGTAEAVLVAPGQGAQATPLASADGNFVAER